VGNNPVAIAITPAVATPPTVDEQLAQLLTAVTGVGPGKSLANKVKLIQGYVAANNKTGACSLLTAFIHEVKAQTGKKLTIEQAASFTTQANSIKTALGC
jgi:hypothetical protein